MMEIKRHYGRPLLGALLGGVLGLLLYFFVGCRTGACPLIANPWLAAVLWGLLGLALGARPADRSAPARPGDTRDADKER